MNNSNSKCASCGADIAGDFAFCQMCGKPTQLAAPKKQIIQNVAPSAQKVSPAPASLPAYVEPSTAFASGLPEWSIEPPAVVIRRKVRI